MVRQGRFYPGLLGVVPALLGVGIERSAAQERYILEFATVSHGGGVTTNGSLLVVGQPVAGKATGQRFSIDVGAVVPLASAGGIDCDLIEKFKVTCKRGKLKASVKSSLGGGTELTIDNQGDRIVVSLSGRGKGKAKWKNESGRHEVFIVECSERRESVECG